LAMPALIFFSIAFRSAFFSLPFDSFAVRAILLFSEIAAK
jgi:hypothetical protein